MQTGAPKICPQSMLVAHELSTAANEEPARLLSVAQTPAFGEFQQTGCDQSMEENAATSDVELARVSQILGTQIFPFYSAEQIELQPREQRHGAVNRLGKAFDGSGRAVIHCK